MQVYGPETCGGEVQKEGSKWDEMMHKNLTSSSLARESRAKVALGFRELV